MLVAPAGTNSFHSSVTYACSGLPAGTTCSFNPAQIGGGTGSTNVTISLQTSGPFTGSAGAVAPPKGTERQRHTSWLPLSLPLAGIVLAGLGSRRVQLRWKVVGLCLTLVLTGMVVACGGGSSSPPPPVSVSVSPSAVNTLYPNLNGAPVQAQQFTATVHNATNQGVTWQVNSVAGGNSTFGTIDANGLYTAPATVPNPATFNVTATAQADSSKSGNASVTIKTPTPAGTYPVTVTVTEGSIQHASTFNLTVQ